MGNRVFIIHRWDAKPSDDWYTWMATELTKMGFEVEVPLMPHPEAPVLSEWVNKLTQVVKAPNERTYLIGHSIGCQAIIRYLGTLIAAVNIGGVLLVAPWIHLVNLENKESETIAKPWTETPIDWERAMMHSRKVGCLLSDNDPWVPVTEAGVFKKNLKASVVIEHGQGHFTDQVSKIILKEFLKLI